MYPRVLRRGIKYFSCWVLFGWCTSACVWLHAVFSLS
uniref:Uncharacterized protein n=1 Tax=Anguilla anguilla TaxID=7936 RepID=A0A0E9S8R5_ANGAN